MIGHQCVTMTVHPHRVISAGMAQAVMIGRVTRTVVMMDPDPDPMAVLTRQQLQQLMVHQQKQQLRHHLLMRAQQSRRQSQQRQ